MNEWIMTVIDIGIKVFYLVSWRIWLSSCLFASSTCFWLVEVPFRCKAIRILRQSFLGVCVLLPSVRLTSKSSSIYETMSPNKFSGLQESVCRDAQFPQHDCWIVQASSVSFWGVFGQFAWCWVSFWLDSTDWLWVFCLTKFVLICWFILLSLFVCLSDVWGKRLLVCRLEF